MRLKRITHTQLLLLMEPIQKSESEKIPTEYAVEHFVEHEDKDNSWH